MDCSIPGFPVLHYLPEFAQSHVLWVGDAIQPSHPLSSPFPLALNLSQHQHLSNKLALCIMWPEYWSFSIRPSNKYSGLISFRVDWFDLLLSRWLSKVFSRTTVQKHQFFGGQPSLWCNSHIHMWRLDRHFQNEHWITKKASLFRVYENIALGLAFSQWEIKLMPLADWLRAIERGGSTWVLPSLSWTQREKWVREPSFIHRFIGNIQAKLYSKTVKMQMLFHCVNSMQHAYKERIVILHSQARHVAMHYSECFIGTSLVVQWFRTLCFHSWGYGFSPWLRN